MAHTTLIVKTAIRKVWGGVVRQQTEGVIARHKPEG